MLRHHGGSGRARVIPAGWAAHHRPVTEATFTASVAIRKPGGTPGPFDPETGRSTTTPHDPYFTGAARIQATPTASEVVAGGQEITSYAYLVAVPLAATGAADVDHLVEVTAVDDNGDPELVGKTLTITQVASGSLVWERDLLCDLDHG